jgi:hypothetical protein
VHTPLQTLAFCAQGFIFYSQEPLGNLAVGKSQIAKLGPGIPQATPATTLLHPTQTTNHIHSLDVIG